MTENEDLRREIDDIDGQLRVLRGESDAVADQVGGQSDGSQDPEDVAAELNNAEENAALIETLQQRRDTLASRLTENN
jgi:hypothetical protein